MHSEYIRLVDGADVAVLFIHGIIGTPRHFDDLIPLVPKNISIYNMLLDGHGKGVSDFSHTSMKKWEVQVSRAVDSLLSTHKKLFIVAHSMGTLLAIEQATRRAEISGLFLLAVPIKLFIKPRMLINVTKVFLTRFLPTILTRRRRKDATALARTKIFSNILAGSRDILNFSPRYAAREKFFAGLKLRPKYINR